MKPYQILECLTRQPLLMSPGAVESILTVFQQHAQLSAEDYRLAREGKDVCGDKVALEQMTVDKGLAMIPVKGPLGVNLGPFEKGAGATDYMDIQADLKTALNDEKVENILLVMDTPGGMYGGLPETAKLIDQVAAFKPVWAYVPPGGQCSSAGMYLAASATGRLLAPSASMGSIGVYFAYTDLSEMAKQRGIKVKVFSSGKYKGAGVPGTALTEDQEDMIQERVLELAEEFYGHIRANLGDIPDEAMQGQTFRAEESVRLGFANAIVESLDEMKSFLR